MSIAKCGNNKFCVVHVGARLSQFSCLQKANQIGPLVWCWRWMKKEVRSVYETRISRLATSNSTACTHMDLVLWQLQTQFRQNRKNITLRLSLNANLIDILLQTICLFATNAMHPTQSNMRNVEWMGENVMKWQFIRNMPVHTYFAFCFECVAVVDTRKSETEHATVWPFGPLQTHWRMHAQYKLLSAQHFRPRPESRIARQNTNHIASASLWSSGECATEDGPRKGESWSGTHEKKKREKSVHFINEI